MNIVIDTNVLVSALINPNGKPAQILNLIINNNLTVLYDNRIINEYRNVLIRNKFGFTKEMIEPLLDYIENEGIFITSNPINIKMIDENDKMFVEVSESGKAIYIITGNKKHYPKIKNVVTPSEFIEIYESK